MFRRFDKLLNEGEDSKTLSQLYKENNINPDETAIYLAMDGTGARWEIPRTCDSLSLAEAKLKIATQKAYKSSPTTTFIHHYELGRRKLISSAKQNPSPLRSPTQSSNASTSITENKTSLLTKPETRKKKEEGIPLLRELIIPSEHEGAAIFPNGRIFLIRRKLGVHIMEIDPDSGKSLREKQLSDREYPPGLWVQTFKNKIALSFVYTGTTLIVDIDTLCSEQELNFLIESIDELGDKRVSLTTVNKNGYNPKSYIADVSTLDTAIVDLGFGSSQTFIQSVCVLSDNKLAILTTPYKLEPHLAISGRISIWVELGSGKWMMQRSTAIEVAGRATLKKLNEAQVIQISNIRQYVATQDPYQDNYKNYSILSIIDVHNLTYCRIGSYSTTDYMPTFKVINFNTLVMQSGEIYFSLEVTSRKLIAKQLYFRLKQHDHIISKFAILKNRNMVVFRRMPKHHADSSIFDSPDPFTQISLFNLSPYSISKNYVWIDSSCLSALLPTDINNLIADYCAGDFSVLIENNNSFSTKTTFSTTQTIGSISDVVLTKPTITTNTSVTTTVTLGHSTGKAPSVASGARSTTAVISDPSSNIQRIPTIGVARSSSSELLQYESKSDEKSINLTEHKTIDGGEKNTNPSTLQNVPDATSTSQINIITSSESSDIHLAHPITVNVHR